MNPTQPPANLADLLEFLGLDEDFSDLTAENIGAIPKSQWEPFTEVVPPPAITRYLASGDVLTYHTLDMMEEAVAKAFGVEEPWYITSDRDGTEEAGNLSLKRFMLMRMEP